MPTYTHPDAFRYNTPYRMAVTVAHKTIATRHKAIVVTPNPELSGCNKAVRAALGDEWMVTAWCPVEE